MEVFTHSSDGRIENDFGFITLDADGNFPNLDGPQHLQLSLIIIVSAITSFPGCYKGVFVLLDHSWSLPSDILWYGSEVGAGARTRAPGLWIIEDSFVVRLVNGSNPNQWRKS